MMKKRIETVVSKVSKLPKAHDKIHRVGLCQYRFLYYCNTEIREFDGANAKLFCTKIVNFAKLAVNFCPKKMCFIII